MYLIQERQLKSKRPGAWYHYLPSLTLLDELNAKALLLGFPFLTQGIVTGSVWAKYTYGSYLDWNLTSLPLLLAWFMVGRATIVAASLPQALQQLPASLQADILFLDPPYASDLAEVTLAALVERHACGIPLLPS